MTGDSNWLELFEFVRQIGTFVAGFAVGYLGVIFVRWLIEAFLAFLNRDIKPWK
jgi:uncharacterized membrane protein YjjB (DUF3815 family)